MQMNTSGVPSCGYHAVGSRNSMSTLIFWWFAFEHAPQFCSTFSATFMIETLRICFFGPIHLPQFQINRIWLLLSKRLPNWLFLRSCWAHPPFSIGWIMAKLSEFTSFVAEIVWFWVVFQNCTAQLIAAELLDIRNCWNHFAPALNSIGVVLV